KEAEGRLADATARQEHVSKIPDEHFLPPQEEGNHVRFGGEPGGGGNEGQAPAKPSAPGAEAAAEQPRIRIGEEAAPVSERTQHALDEQAEHEATMAEQAANKNPKAAPHVSEPVAPPASEQPSRFKFGEEKNVQGEEIAAAPKKGVGKAPPTPAEAAEEA